MVESQLQHHKIHQKPNSFSYQNNRRLLEVRHFYSRFISRQIFLWIWSQSVDFRSSLWILDQVHGQIKSPRKIYAPKLKQNDKVYRWDLVKQFYFGLALIKKSIIFLIYHYISTILYGLYNFGYLK